MDIFKSLSFGASFTKKNSFKANKPSTSVAVAVKKEPKVEVKPENDNEDDDIFDDNEIKEEPMSDEDDGPSKLQILSNAFGPQETKTKRKKLTKDEKEKILSIERMNQLRNLHNIKLQGKNPPNPVCSSKELADAFHLSSAMTQNINECGYSQLTPVQMQAIPIMLRERELLCSAPTGSGKTAAFLIPVIHHLKTPEKAGFRALILCPTRELAKQIQREFLRLVDDIGLRSHIIAKLGGKPDKEYKKALQKLYDVLITTPKRLCLALEQEPPLINLSGIKWLIIDEADKLFEDSVNSFRDQLEVVLKHCIHPQKRVALFSATTTPTVTKWAKTKMKNFLRLTVGAANSAVDSVEQELLFVGSEGGKLLAMRDLVRRGLQPPVLVFVQSKDRAQQLFNELIYDGLNVDVIHADRSQQERDNIVKHFREGKIWILICTELMGRGIDFKGVNLVVNYDFPQSPISYIHRIGRAGRAGRRGRAVTLFTVNDTVNLRSIAQIIKRSGGTVPEYMLKLKKSSKGQRDKFSKTVPKRAKISTTVGDDKKRKFKKSKKDKGVKSDDGEVVSKKKFKKSGKQNNENKVANDQLKNGARKAKKAKSSERKNFVMKKKKKSKQE